MEKVAVELFAGVGGFRVGLNNIEGFDEETGRAQENRNWEFVWANQWEPSTKAQPAYDCYCTRFGADHVSNTNISEVNKDNIPNHNLLVGGFPCQDYSVARSLHNEAGIQGKKGVLFWDIVEILQAKRPSFVLLENVDRLLKSPSKQRGRDFGIMLRTFHDEGYNVEWRVINAADYGARQRRRRTFIFAWSRDTLYNDRFNELNGEDIILRNGLFANQFPVEQEEEPKVSNVDLTEYNDTVDMTKRFRANFLNSGCCIDGNVTTVKTTPVFEEAIPLRDVLQHNVDEKYYLSKEKREKFDYLKGPKRIERTSRDGFIYTFSEGGIANPDNLDAPGRTMLTSEGTVNRSTHIVDDLDTHRRRILTPVEAERLQHFPDNWTNTGMTDRQRFFMMGNALVTYVINRCEPYLDEVFDAEPDSDWE